MFYLLNYKGMAEERGLEPRTLSAQLFSRQPDYQLSHSSMAEALRIERRHQLPDGHLSGVLRYHYSMLPLVHSGGVEPTVTTIKSRVPDR